jgi:hypothetical protein
MVLGLAATAQADGSWLDQPPQGWNQPGQAVPAAPSGFYGADAMCVAQERPPETAQDQALVSAGWHHLIDAYQGGWGVMLVGGSAGYDGMCRPNGYQFFVFMNGQFAGTLSPDVMDARSDGSGQVQWMYGPSNIAASFVHYLPEDPLCCPSGGSVIVYYAVTDTPAGPVVNPTQMIKRP